MEVLRTCCGHAGQRVVGLVKIQLALWGVCVARSISNGHFLGGPCTGPSLLKDRPWGRHWST